MGAAGLLFLPLLMVGCNRSDEPSQQELLSNITSQLCTDVRGVQALFWDMNNGILRGDIPGGVPTIKNPGAYYIHSGYPALGFQMPQGYRAVEVSGSTTIGVNVLRNDDNALWRYVTTSFFGTTNANQVLQSEINQMVSNLGNPQNVTVVCSNASNRRLTADMQSTSATALVRAGNFTALIAANVNTMATTNSSFVGIQMTLGPTAEYDQLVLDTFLPISYQLLFIDRGSIEDSDGDGVPDDKDRAPFDPAIQ